MFQVFVSVWRVFRYHLGTVAFGSIIIALVQLIRLIMKYLEKKAKDVRRDLFAPNFRAKKPMIDFVQFQVKA